jgi:hypothetical protein
MAMNGGPDGNAGGTQLTLELPGGLRPNATL